MLNQVVLVGRVVSDLKKETNKKGVDISSVKLAISRNYKNDNGEYDVDFISYTLTGGIAKSSNEYLKKGDLVGVRGRIETLKDNLCVVAKKLTFLSQREDACEG